MFGLALKVPEKKNRIPEPSAASGASLPGGVLFEALMCEIHWASLQIAGITCVMNACMERGLIAVPNSCRNHFPVESQVVFAALTVWDELGLPKALGTRIERLFKELASAKGCTEPFIGAAHAGNSYVLPLQTMAQLTAVWRALSSDACDVVNSLEPEARWRVGGQYSENSLMLNRFLKDAIQGKRTCVDVQGEVVLPVLPQRRRAQRFSLQQSCKIAVRGKIVVGFAQDISMYGMGLTCDFPFKVKEQIFIEIQTGRRFKGLVVWTNNGRLGVQFETALARTDPLIFG